MENTKTLHYYICGKCGILHDVTLGPHKCHKEGK